MGVLVHQRIFAINSTHLIFIKKLVSVLPYKALFASLSPSGIFFFLKFQSCAYFSGALKYYSFLWATWSSRSLSSIFLLPPTTCFDGPPVDIPLEHCGVHQWPALCGNCVYCLWATTTSMNISLSFALSLLGLLSMHQEKRPVLTIRVPACIIKFVALLHIC